MSKRWNSHGLGPALMLRTSELRRLGVSRRLNSRYLTDAELRDADDAAAGDEDLYLEADDGIGDE